MGANKEIRDPRYEAAPGISLSLNPGEQAAILEYFSRHSINMPDSDYRDM
jgi:hypothetical protein